MPYIEQFGGYVADTAYIDFIRCDGTSYHYDKTTTTAITRTTDSININGGHSMSPLATIATTSTIEITFASAQWDLTMFEMANAVKQEDRDTDVREANLFSVETGLVVKVPYEINMTNFYIPLTDFAITSAAPTVSGQVQAAYTEPTASAGPVTTLTFFAGDVTVGQSVLVSYNRRVIDAHIVSVKTDSATSMGELWAHWPVYAGGEDCTDASIIGWIHMRIYRVRVSAPPGMDTSYKTAATVNISFAAMDPRRPDKNMFEISYEMLENGEFVNPDENSPDYEFSI